MADDLTRPFIGYRSAGRRPESQQNRRASADAPLAALRGAVSGVLGAPGDIESLVRMLPGLNEQTVLPTSEDIEKRLPMRSVSQTPAGRAFTTGGQLGGGFYTGPGSPLRAIAALPSAVSRAGRDFAMASGQPAVNVVKPKGGNWLAGSVERAVEPMKTADPSRMTEEQLLRGAWENTRPLSEPQAAMNRWLETKLAKYMRNEMATPEDPLRLQADAFPAIKAQQLAVKDAQLAKARADMEAARQARGFTPEMMTSSQARIRELERERDFIDAQMGLHVDPQQIGLNRYLASDIRRKSGNPAMGESEAAKAWEDASDVSIGQMPAGELLRQGYAEQMPWLAKVPPETPVYLPSQSDPASNLGFSHLTDELRNAINPESGLPRELLLKYTDLDKLTVPQVSKRVDEINAWRSVQKAEADMARAGNAATQVVKEYPEQGFKWVELRQPKETGKKIDYLVTPDEIAGLDDAQVREMLEEMAEYEGFVRGTREFEEYVRDMTPRSEMKTVDESYKALEDALKYEGEMLQHCVGGYCPDVVEGRSKIYSLRDDRGRPHVTIEVKPGSWFEATNNLAADDAEFFNSELNRRFHAAGMSELPKMKEINKVGDTLYFEMFGSLPPEEIVQIKGKGNKAPKEEYLPAVQDFVRSGNWGRVGDLKNAGLIDARVAGNPLPGRPAFMTEDEFKAFQNELSGETPPAEGFARGGQVRGYQAGGVVNLAKATAKNIGELVRKYTPETQLNEATQVAEEIKKLGPQFLPKIEQTNGGSVYLTVSKSPLTKQGVPSKNRNSTPIDFKARFADHPSYWGSTISSDPVTGNTPETIVKMFKHKIGSGDLPAYSEARFNPADKYGYVTDIRREEGVSHKGNPVMKTIKDERPFTFYEPGARGKGYAEGGQVTGANFPTDDFDPDRIDAIVAELHALNAG